MTRITWTPPSVPITTQAHLRVERIALEHVELVLSAPQLGTPLTVSIAGPSHIRALIRDLEACLEEAPAEAVA